MTTLHLKPNHETRIKNGHLWAFAGEIVEPLKGLEPGEAVALCEARGLLLGRGYVNPHSLIAVRLLTRGNESFDEGLILRRVKAAWEYRKKISLEGGINPALQESNACRLIYSESDGLPGLIVDKFGDQLVMQSLTVGIEKRLDEVVAALVEVVKPTGIYFKGKSPYRKMEGLVEEDRQIYGSTPDKVLFKDNGLIFTARPKEGQKTGYFLDQRGNRQLLSELVARTIVRATGVRVLDLYSYTGGWGLTALAAGAKEAVMVDSSAKAIAWGTEDAALNGLSDKAIFVQADVEEFLKEEARRVGRTSSPTNRVGSASSRTSQAGRLTYAGGWDVVIVDPPALIPNRQAVSQGVNAYIAINRAALRVVVPGGLLVTCSCSHLLTREKHLEVIGRAAFQEGQRVRVVATGGHAPDHPILPGHPETEYLKCWILSVN